MLTFLRYPDLEFLRKVSERWVRAGFFPKEQLEVGFAARHPRGSGGVGPATSPAAEETVRSCAGGTCWNSVSPT